MIEYKEIIYDIGSKNIINNIKDQLDSTTEEYVCLHSSDITMTNKDITCPASDIIELSYKIDTGSSSEELIQLGRSEVGAERLDLLFPNDAKPYYSELTIYNKDLLKDTIKVVGNRLSGVSSHIDYLIQILIYRRSDKLIINALNADSYGVKTKQSTTSVVNTEITFKYISRLLKNCGTQKDHYMSYHKYSTSVLNKMRRK